jgi:hypothetical protein
MQAHTNHVIFDEITYDRYQLVNWYERYKHLTIGFSEWMNARGNSKFRTGGLVAAQTINLDGALGRYIKDEPEIAPLVKMFNVTKPLGPFDVDIMIYPSNYVLKAHTDFAMKAGIMFPILPVNPSPINFYNVPPGETLTPATEYDVDYNRDLNYSYQYSIKHPSMFRSQVIHDVRNKRLDKERVFLRFKLLYDDFDDIVQRATEGNWINLT